MSPEQVESKALDQRTDIYSFGVTCYHMFAGHPPFQGKTPFEVAYQHVHGTAEPLEKIRTDLPGELCAIVHKMMARDPDKRYQTARELAKDLARLQETTLVTAVTVGTGSGIVSASLSGTNAVERTLTMQAQPASALQTWRRRFLPWVAACTILLAFAGSALLGWWTKPPSQPPVDAGIEDLRYQRKRELFLLSAVKERYVHPLRYADRRAGVGYALELGAIYFSQWRLDEADELFTGLMDNPYQVKEYMTLGRLGRAMVLAFRDQTAESNQLLMELVNDPDQTLLRLGTPINRSSNQVFLQVLVQALDHNAVNSAAAGIPFPSQLEALRRARPLPMKQSPPRGGPRPDGRT
jgi:serine/threonine-protein kinase